MVDVCSLLDLSRSIVTQVSLKLLESISEDYKSYSHSPENPKEVKSIADTVLEKEICRL
jgi:hypothetical protein